MIQPSVMSIRRVTLYIKSDTYARTENQKLERFRAKRIPVRLKKTRQTGIQSLGSD
jgi:hypothetical protein